MIYKSNAEIEIHGSVRSPFWFEVETHDKLFAILWFDEKSRAAFDTITFENEDALWLDKRFKDAELIEE